MTSSAAPALKELLKDAIEEIEGLETLRAPQEVAYRPISNARAYIAQALAILEAPPAAERTALKKKIKSCIESLRILIPTSEGTEWISISGGNCEMIRNVLDELDAASASEGTNTP